MANFKNILTALELFLRDINAPILDKLGPGIDKTDIELFAKKSNLFFDEEIYELYEWRNGIANPNENIIGEMTLFTNGIFYCLEEAIRTYKSYALDLGSWDQRFFPLFSSGGGDFLLVNLGERNSDKHVFLYSPPLLYSSELISIYDSLEKLFISVFECYKREAYYFEDNVLEKNINLEFEICIKNNPNAAYWKQM
jgi:hypothetical protein